MKHLLFALGCAAMLAQAPALAQTSESQRNEELKAHIAAPKNFKEAGIYYGAADGYEIANSPKITADRNAYRVFGRIEISPNQTAFIARYYFDGLDSPDPRTRQITRESMRLFGRTKTPYFQVQIPSGLRKAYANNARMNSIINVVGTYVGNTEIVMTTNQRVQIPVFEALFLEFGDNGPIAMVPLKSEPQKSDTNKRESDKVLSDMTESVTSVLATYKQHGLSGVQIEITDCDTNAPANQKFKCTYMDAAGKNLDDSFAKKMNAQGSEFFSLQNMKSRLNDRIKNPNVTQQTKDEYLADVTATIRPIMQNAR
jgi:hypothetical protein